MKENPADKLLRQKNIHTIHQVLLCVTNQCLTYCSQKRACNVSKSVVGLLDTAAQLFHQAQDQALMVEMARRIPHLSPPFRRWLTPTATKRSCAIGPPLWPCSRAIVSNKLQVLLEDVVLDESSVEEIDRSAYPVARKALLAYDHVPLVHLSCLVRDLQFSVNHFLGADPIKGREAAKERQ